MAGARDTAVTQGPEHDVTLLAPGRGDGERVTALGFQAGPLGPGCRFLTKVRCDRELDSQASWQGLGRAMLAAGWSSH